MLQVITDIFVSTIHTVHLEVYIQKLSCNSWLCDIPQVTTRHQLCWLLSKRHTFLNNGTNMRNDPQAIKKSQNKPLTDNNVKPTLACLNFSQTIENICWIEASTVPKRLWDWEGPIKHCNENCSFPANMWEIPAHAQFHVNVWPHYPELLSLRDTLTCPLSSTLKQTCQVSLRLQHFLCDLIHRLKSTI